MSVRVEIAYGELLDRITILEIKRDRVVEEDRRANIERELTELRRARAAAVAEGPELAALEGRLKAVNAELWRIEDDIRDCERRKDFGAEFIELARSVYLRNDLRAAIKREIDELLGSPLVEEKLYREY